MIRQSPTEEYVLIFAMQDCFYRAEPWLLHQSKDSRPIRVETSRGYIDRNSNMLKDHYHTCTRGYVVQ